MSFILDLIIFLISYSVLSIVFALILIGLIMGTFLFMKIGFKMNEERWDNLFRYKNNFVLILIIVICLMIALVITFFISNLFFEFISYKYRNISSTLIILFLVLPIIFKFFKLKDYLKGRLTKDVKDKDLFD
ncbi:hypothetical protein [Clostridium sp. Ade.TY]|uniref:hypothetical protein n=1 Tax=Clostridium sp. Ade.TY TaxID=1391647 RepID=UPI00041C09C3|nr:hypothetical protein [Clostridium sp. Ade.TY]